MRTKRDASTERDERHGSFVTLVCATSLVALSACAAPEIGARGPGTVAAAETSEQLASLPVRDDYRAQALDDDPAFGSFSHHVNGAAGFVGNLIKTYTSDPLTRPVSTIRSLGYLVKNTVSDIAHQLYISMFRMPEIASRPTPPLARGPGMDLDDWERELDEITASAASVGTLEFLIDGEEFFPALVESIESATESIHVRTYIFDNDDFAVRVADVLKRRSHEIDVRTQVDGLGTLTGGLAVSDSMPRSFEPPASIAEYLREGSRVRVRTLTNPWFTGDHAKVTIVDRKAAFLGGMNIGREYRFDWHDLMVRVEGPVVEELALDSDRAWGRSGAFGDLAVALQSPPAATVTGPADGIPIRVLYTRPQESQIYEAQLAAIRRARRYIYIENPYFTDDTILFELVAARRRGVDVRFILPREGDAPLMDMSNVQAINTMIRNGIRVYLYPGMTHVKATIVDGWVMVGSANLDKLSLRVNNEINIATSDDEAAAALMERLFRADFERSVELEGELPAGVRYHFAEVVADIFL